MTAEPEKELNNVCIMCGRGHRVLDKLDLTCAFCKVFRKKNKYNKAYRLASKKMNKFGVVAMLDGVACICGNKVVFSKDRHGKDKSVICPLCMRGLWREKTGDPVLYKDKVGKFHELREVQIKPY